MFDWNAQALRIRNDFPFFAHPDNQGWIYFDNAATSLKPKPVLDAEYDYNTRYTANIHRAVFENSYKASDAYEKSRAKIAAFLGAAHACEVIFTSGTTAGINNFARSYAETFLTQGGRIICSEMEHHANLVVWQKTASEFDCELVFIPLTPSGELDLSSLPKLLTPDTKLAALTAVSNVLGTVNPIEEIAALCRSKGVHTFVDAAQAVQHRPLNLKDSGIDFAAFSGHKMFAPTGVGVFWGRRALLEKLPPFLYGGGMVYEVNLQKTSYAAPPARFEGGTPPIAQAIALGAAADYIGSLGWERLHNLEEHNLQRGLQLFTKYETKGIRLIGSAPQRVPIFSFDVRGVHPHDVGSFLSEQKIAVRTGHQCTQPLMASCGLSSVTRVSAAPYNTPEDWSRLDTGLAKLLEFFDV